MEKWYKNRQAWVFIVLTLLVIVGVTGVLESRSFSFIKDITERNLGFLGLVTELKLIFSSIGDFVPFLKDHNASLGESLEKAEHYLLIVNAISLIQLMLLEISKTWVFKVLLLGLLVLSFFKAPKFLSVKLLILVLAINPGLQIFSITMNQLSHSSSLNYGDEYLIELKAIVQKVDEERSQMMQEHAQKLTEINNGKKGIVLFKKLKEDISYDLKKAKTTISGDYQQVRLLIHDGGKEIIRKLFIFCTTILFSLLIVPIGYAAIVYTLYHSVVTVQFKQQIKSIEDKVEQEVIEKPKAKIQKVIQKPKDLIHKANAKVKGVEASLKDHVSEVEGTVREKEQEVKSTIDTTEEKAKSAKESVETEISNEENSVKYKVKKAEKGIDDLKKKL